MWSAIPKVIELLLRRSRLRVGIDWTVAADPDAYRPDARALRVDVVNPVGHDIPIDTITICCGSHVVEVDNVLCATCPHADSVVPARDRCQYWLSQIGLGRTLLGAGLTGTCPLHIEVKHSTGRRSASNRIDVDLEILRLWLWIDEASVDEASAAARRRFLKNTLPLNANLAIRRPSRTVSGVSEGLAVNQ